MAVLSRSRVDAMGLAFLMLFFGVIETLHGSYVRELDSLDFWLAVASVVLLISGLFMTGAAIWIFASLGRKSRPWRIGGMASLVAGLVLFNAAWTGVLQCSGPD